MLTIIKMACLALQFLVVFSFSYFSVVLAAYPDRPITIVSPYSAGGDADLAARSFAQAASKALGQSVVVLNKPGASGVLGSSQVISAQPDGYTLLLGRTGSQAILPAIMPTNTRYTWDNYTFIGMLEVNPYGCVVSADSPYQNFDDLAQAIKKSGKSLNYGTAGRLTTNDMGPRKLFSLLKVTPQNTPTQIPYKGTGEAVISLLAGQTQFSCGSLGSFLTHIKAGELRALMVTTDKRLDQFPDVPTARELGYDEMETIVGWSAVLAPKNLPKEVQARLAVAMQAIAKDQQWQSMTARTGSIPHINSGDETKTFIGKQYELYRSLGEELGIIDNPN